MAKITIIIHDEDLGFTKDEIFDKVEACVEYELYAANYEIDVDLDD